MPRKVRSRRLSMEPLEARQLLSVDLQGHAQVAAFQPPVPALEGLSYPSSITLGDSARIRVRLDDRASGSNDTGYITFSFPSMTSHGDEDNARDNGSSRDLTYFEAERGDTVYHATKGKMSAKYLMVEGSESGWEAGEENTLSVEVTPTSTGKFYFYVRGQIVGTDGVVYKAPSSSTYIDQQGWPVNRYTIDVQDPADLMVTSLSPSSATVAYGESFTLSTAVENQGDLTAPSSTVSWYVSSNPSLHGSRVANSSVGSLNGGSSSGAIRKTFTMDDSFGEPGEILYFFTRADRENDVDEGTRGGENNNWSDRSGGPGYVTVVVGQPHYHDLYAHAVGVDDDTPEPGQTVRVRYTVSDQGNKGDRTGAFTNSVVWSTDDSAIELTDSSLSSENVPGLSSGDNTGTRYIDVQIPSDAEPGRTYYIGVYADSANVVDESDGQRSYESNNASGGIAMTVEAPNHPPTISSLLATPDPVTQDANLTLTAEDVSDPDAGDSVTKVEFYLDSNTNGTLDAGSDTKLGEGTKSGADWTWTGSASGLPVGSSRYFARAFDGEVWSATTLATGVVQTPVATPEPLPPGEWTIVIHGLYDKSYETLLGSDGFYGQMNAKVQELSANVLPLRHNADSGTVAYLNGEEIQPGHLPKDKHYLLFVDWTQASNLVWSAIGWPGWVVRTPDPTWHASGEDGYAESSADAVLALLNEYGALDLGQQSSQVHQVIGHSRGAVVASELSQRILSLDLPAPMSSFLDGEGGDAVTVINPLYPNGPPTIDLVNYSDSGFYAWQGTTVINYYDYDLLPLDVTKMLGPPDTAVPGIHHEFGQDGDMDGAVNVRVIGDQGQGAHYGHSDFWKYLVDNAILTPSGGYIVTAAALTDDGVFLPALNPSDAFTWDRPPTSDGFFNEASGYPFSEPDPRVIVNGDFEYESTAGWFLHGGGGTGLVKNSWDNWFLELSAGHESREHNWMCVPAETRSLQFQVRVPSGGKGEKLQVYYSGESDPIWELSLEDTIPEWGTSPAIPLPVGSDGDVGTFRFALFSPSTANAIVEIDDVRLVPGDTTAPTVTINQADGQADPASDSPINFTVIFSEPVVDFSTGDVTVGGTAPGPLTAIVTGSGTTYNVAVSGMTGSGTVTPTVAAGAAHDASGNPNAESTSTDNVVTFTLANVAPAVDSLSAMPDVVTQGDSLTLTPLDVDDPDGSVVTVEFYRDTNNNGALDLDADELLYLDTTSSDWSCTIPTDEFSAGTVRFFARAQDNDGAWSNVVATTVVVDAIPPRADAGGPYSGEAGTAITLDASKSTGNSPLRYEWDLDNDGQYDDGTGVTTIFRSPDDGIFTIGLKVTDEDDLADTTAATVTITTESPVGSLEAGDILVTGGSGDAIIAIDPDTGLQSVIASGGHLTNPRGLTVDPEGKILVVNPGQWNVTDGKVIEIDPVTGVQTVLSSAGELIDPTGITLLPDGSIVVSDGDTTGNSRKVIQIDRDTGDQTLLSHGGYLYAPGDIACDSSGTVYVADPNAFGGPGGIIAIDPAIPFNPSDPTANQRIIWSSSDADDPHGIAIDTNGDILFSDGDSASRYDGQLFRLDMSDPEHITRTLVAERDYLIEPRHIDLDLSGNVVAADWNSPWMQGPAREGRVAGVDITSGSQSLVTAGDQLTRGVWGIAVVPVLSYVPGRDVSEVDTMTETLRTSVPTNDEASPFKTLESDTVLIQQEAESQAAALPRGLAEDAVFGQAVERRQDEVASVASGLNWLFGLDSTSTWNQPFKRDRTQTAADEVFAMNLLWTL